MIADHLGSFSRDPQRDTLCLDVKIEVVVVWSQCRADTAQDKAGKRGSADLSISVPSHAANNDGLAFRQGLIP